ncbi:MAG: TonB-dependent receptor [Alphaproteobacteria bacterium]|nr:MAG: TonB-dependent receptor [Alphaproteobacteria bacterium]
MSVIDVRRIRSTGILFVCLMALSWALAAGPAMSAVVQEVGETPETVIYTPDFFARYHPITALDMVVRVPGFRLDNGDGRRGFSGSAGNVLINGERPSTKSDPLSQILARLPAERVSRIELIRGRTGGLDVGGQSIVVNVILKQEAPAAYQWQIDVEQDADGGPVTPSGRISRSDHAGASEYNIGAEVRRFFFNSAGPELVFLGAGPGEGLDETRDEISMGDGLELKLNGNSETRIGRSIIHANGELSFFHFNRRESSHRVPVDPFAAVRDVREGGGNDRLGFELGSDIEHAFTDSFSGKLIGLGRRQHFDNENFRIDRFTGGELIRDSRADSTSTSTEIIARGEFDWTGIEDHHLEVNLEGAYNRLSNSLTVIVTEPGSSATVPVPGANTVVEERRGDFTLQDSWQAGRWVLEGRMAAEVSRISQSGEAARRRSFAFLKPRFAVTFDQTPHLQWRFVAERDVAQLDFFDFVSATNFGDEQLALGNPDLVPERTWKLEPAVEYRFGEIGVVRLTGFYHRIADVQDLLPLADGLEIPGNIGPGRRFGIRWEMTWPLDRWIGLTGARLDIEGRLQGSRVTDLVTGRPRPLSGERRFVNTFDFRQDFEKARLAWGWNMRLVSRRPSFGLDELVLEDEGVNIDMFIETTRWWGIKARLTVENLADRDVIRDRRVFVLLRDQSPLAFQEFRNRPRGRSIVLTLSGTF